MTIGERAARAIKSRANQNKTSIVQECAALGVTRKIMFDWEKNGRNPSAYWLQQMALSGYDVIYILTGKENLHVDD